ncbi:hypothetical protein U9M48_001311, partial [Paspalum notatum var. saurae]
TVVDSDTTNFKDFVDDILRTYPCVPTEVVKIYYFCEQSNSHTEVTTDQELVDMFDKHEDTKFIRLSVGYFDASKPVVPIPNWGSTNPEPSEPASETITVVPGIGTLSLTSEPNQSADNASHPVVDEEVDTYLINPFPEFEHVGIDEEGLYSDDDNADKVKPTKDHEVEYVPSFESDSEIASDDEEQQDPSLPHEPEYVHDANDPSMTVGSIYPNMGVFRLALAQHSIKHEFEYNIQVSEPGRFRAYCCAKSEGCKWRIHASKMQDDVSIQVKVNPFTHDCRSTRRSGKVKQATKFWVAEKVKDGLMDDDELGPKELQRRIKDEHKVVVSYKRIFYGKELAMQQLHGDWHDSFNNLYRFKAAVEEASPGSFVVIDHHEVNEKPRFNRVFFALKACIDGFLNGCRPYLAIDSTFLTGKFKGQLAVACAVDGHNWLYPVAFGVFDLETIENWSWFMERLKARHSTRIGHLY